MNARNTHSDRSFRKIPSRVRELFGITASTAKQGSEVFSTELGMIVTLTNHFDIR